MKTISIAKSIAKSIATGIAVGINDSVSYQGVIWDASADTYTRLGSIAEIPTSQSASTANLPIQGAMKRCLLNDNGTVNYFLDANNSALKDDGVTSSDLTGADGQVMVRIPKFYYKQSKIGNLLSWQISLYQISGYTIHPAFVKDGVEVDYRYYSAFEGSMHDASEGAMTAKASIPVSLYAAGDKMCSVTGQWAKSNETRTEYRAMAAERGTGWRQLDYYLNSAIQLLYLIEYADFNSQTMIGNGRTSLSGGVWEADSYIGKTGLSITDGNGTNSVANGGANYATDYMTYRGIENWYGNVYKMLDGLTWDGTWTGAAADQPVYATNNSAYFADQGSVGMMHLCDASYIGASSGYISNLEDATGFIPSEATGSSTTKITDYYYQYSEVARDYWRVPLFGGNADCRVAAGGFLVDARNAWSNGHAAYAGRLCF